MKFKASDSDKHKIRANLDMTPLIDVVFQLIIFFMLTSTFVTQSAIPIEMSESEGTGDYLSENLTITLSAEAGGPDGEGMVYINEVAIAEWAELSNTLTDYNEQQSDRAVIVRPDRRVPTGRTVQVLGLITSAGIERYFIAAEQPQEGG